MQWAIPYSGRLADRRGLLLARDKVNPDVFWLNGDVAVWISPGVNDQIVPHPSQAAAWSPALARAIRPRVAYATIDTEGIKRFQGDVRVRSECPAFASTISGKHRVRGAGWHGVADDWPTSQLHSG